MVEVKYFLVLFVKENKEGLYRALRSGVNLLVSRDGETFGFTSLEPDTVKAPASLKKTPKIHVRDSYLNLGTA